MRAILCLLVVSAPVAAGAISAEGRFGDRGVLVPSGRVSLDVNHFAAPTGGGTTAFSLNLAPGLLGFVTDHIAIGGSLSLNIATASGASTNIGGGLEFVFGYELTISEAVSWFPQAGLGVFHFADITAIPFRFDMPFLFHIGNWFLGAGPYFSVQLIALTDGTNVGRTISVGVGTQFGRWFSLGGDPDDYEPPPEERRRRPAGAGDNWDI